MRFLLFSSNGWWAGLALWTGACMLAFVALGDAKDPSRPDGRISPYRAEIIARERLRELDPVAYARFETVDSAIYRDPVSGRRVWLVLCDDETPSKLTRAIVVEIDAASGSVVGERRPGGAGGDGDVRR